MGLQKPAEPFSALDYSSFAFSHRGMRKNNGVPQALMIAFRMAVGVNPEDGDKDGYASLEIRHWLIIKNQVRVRMGPRMNVGIWNWLV